MHVCAKVCVLVREMANSLGNKLNGAFYYIGNLKSVNFLIFDFMFLLLKACYVW